MFRRIYKAAAVFFPALFVTAATLLFAAPAMAQFPSKPIRVIVPFPAGTATDVVARILAQSVSTSIGQPVLVDNKAGADGAIGATDRKSVV